MKLGLKIWSTNEKYFKAINQLYTKGVFDFIEIFIVPGSSNFISLWRELKMPVILHAPHSASGFNPSLAEKEKNNKQLLLDVNIYFRKLRPKNIIFHPGITGNIDESIRQFNLFSQLYNDLFSIALIENKPSIGLNGEFCVGDSPESIVRIMKETGFGFCFDIGHAFCYAAANKLSWDDVLKSFTKAKPSLYHISDNISNETKDQHLNLGQGNYDFNKIFQIVKTTNNWFSIETNKNYSDRLDDFEKDALFLRSCYHETN